jgi:hypothetical protein
MVPLSLKKSPKKIKNRRTMMAKAVNIIKVLSSITCIINGCPLLIIQRKSKIIDSIRVVENASNRLFLDSITYFVSNKPRG